jgi:hypothetical protein
MVHIDADVPKGASGALGLYPNTPYRPIPRLVALFSRASSTPGNPRAPIIKPHAATAFLYTVIVMHPSENGRSGKEFGQEQWASGSATCHASGQGAMYDRGGFPPVNKGFHLCFAGRGPYSGNGGGRNGARGRPAGWQSQARGGFGSQEGSVMGSSNSQSRGINFREVIENRDHQVVVGASRVQQTVDRGISRVIDGWNVTPRAEFGETAGATGSVSVGGEL